MSDRNINFEFLKIINDFTFSLMTKQTVEEIAWDIAQNAMAKLAFEDCVIYLLDESNTHLFQVAAHGPKTINYQEIVNPITIPLGKGIVGTVAQSGIVERIKDTRLDERYIIDDQMRLSELCVPIIVGEEVIGVIDSEHSKLNYFTDFHVQVMVTISTIVGNKIMEAKARGELENYKDQLENIVKKRTAELTNTLEKLKKSNQSFTHFGYTVSHDLREPLRMISSYLNLLNRRLGSEIDDFAKECMHYAIDGAQRMDRLIVDLLSYSKISTDDSAIESIDLNIVVQVVLLDLKIRIQDVDAELIVGDLPVIYAKPASMTILFQNLIGNALKFIRKDVKPIIQIQSETKGDKWVISIADNGIGIPEGKSKEKIFDIFHRLHIGDSDYKGTGIGLALVHNIVEQHNGSIYFDSQLDVGTTFHIEFPIPI